VNIDVTYIIIVLIAVLISMVVHEVMHGYVSYWLGDDTAKLQGRLTLNPIKHVDPFLTILLPISLALVGGPIFGGAKPIPFNPYNIKYKEWGIALVAIAGPLTNFILAFVFFALWAFLRSGSDLVAQVLLIAVYVNLGFFIFNIIPIPPLDGSRVLYALAPEFARRILEAVEPYGILIVFGVVLFASSFIFSFMSDSIIFFLSIFGRVFGI
jgi:Zn-dependent protease